MPAFSQATSALPLDSADDQQWAIFNVVVGMVMRDEDRLQRAEGNASANELIGDAHAAIEYVCQAIAQHHVRSHLARAVRYGTGGSTSLVSFASCSAACACCGVQRGPSVCARLCSVVPVAIGVAAKPARRLRREKPNGPDVSIPGCRWPCLMWRDGIGCPLMALSGLVKSC